MLNPARLYNRLRQTMDMRSAATLAETFDSVFDEMRNLVTKVEFGELRDIVRDLAEAQKRGESRIERLETAVRELAEAQKRTEARVEELAEAQKRTEARVEELAEAQKRTEARVEELAEAQKRTEARVEELAEAQKRTEQVLAELVAAQKRTEERLDRLENRMAKVEGRTLEMEYREKAGGFFSRLLRKPVPVPRNDLTDALEAHLSPEELDDVLLTDLVLSGRSRRPGQAEVSWLAVEISVVVDREDVQRVLRRAALLRKAGYPVIPAVAGEKTTLGAEEIARSEQVAVLQDGRCLLREEALARWG